MPLFSVPALLRVTYYDVEADTPEEAMEKVESAIDGDFNIGDVEATDAFLVDEEGN